MTATAIIFLVSVGSMAAERINEQPAVAKSIKVGELISVPWLKSTNILHLKSISSDEISFTFRYGEEKNEVTPERKLRIGEGAILDIEKKILMFLKSIDSQSRVARVEFRQFGGSMHFSQKIILSVGQSEKILHRGVSIQLKKISSDAAVLVTSTDGIQLEESAKTGGYLFQKIFGHKGLQLDSISGNSIVLIETY